MKQGFIKVSVVTPDLKVADCDFNAAKIREAMRQCAAEGSKLVVFPELCLTGYTCGDLFLQDVLLLGALDGLKTLVEESRQSDLVTIVGLPYLLRGKLYNCAAIVCRGEILGLVPKKHIPNYSEFYECRHFSMGPDECEWISLLGQQVPFGVRQLFSCREIPEFTIAVELCEDLWAPIPPSSYHALAGATVIVNLSASDEVTGKGTYRRELVSNQSARLLCAYLYADAGEGESTTDLVFTGHDLIAENGTILIENESRCNGIFSTEIDVNRLTAERRRISSFQPCGREGYVIREFSAHVEETKLTRVFRKTPFVPDTAADRRKRCQEITTLQALGLKKRLAHIGCHTAVVGISGGLDSTLALLVTVQAFSMLGFDKSGILAVTMPCFGTTSRTYENALSLMSALGVTIREVPILAAVRQHFADIGQSEEVHDVTYENSQARERTQVLMDLANQRGGIVVGTGDLSELALGWSTYNVDHMSMYGVNASVPKTLVRYLVQYYAETTDNPALSQVLFDILDTPVSPELLPARDGEISQKTEQLVGPYELHDFFLYYMIRFGHGPAKIFRLAKAAFGSEYEEREIYQWLFTFYHRFFSQQFKRSCLPDGPKVGSVALSPRGDWRMPSDASWALWQKELEEIRPGR